MSSSPSRSHKDSPSANHTPHHTPHSTPSHSLDSLSTHSSSSGTPHTPAQVGVANNLDHAPTAVTATVAIEANGDVRMMAESSGVNCVGEEHEVSVVQTPVAGEGEEGGERGEKGGAPQMPEWNGHVLVSTISKPS